MREIIPETTDGYTVTLLETTDEKIGHNYACDCWICNYKKQRRKFVDVTYQLSPIGMFNNGWEVMMPQPDDDSFFK